LKETRPTSR